jgi:predicted dehydrogenase
LRFCLALTRKRYRIENRHMNSPNVTRRQFLRTATTAAAASALPLWFLEREMAYAAAPKALSANDRPGIALIGCGGMGRGDAGNARRFGEILAVCDVDSRQAEQAAKEFARNGKKPDVYKDFRKVMERDDIHIVINGTPDHWHTLINILAVRTGRDVYSEKPLTLTIDEGKRLVKAVKDSGRILQVGSQQRSDRNFRLACELVRNGRIGKLRTMIVGLPTGPRQGPFKAVPVPEGMDWGFYLGSTPEVDYNGHNAHWNFRWWYQFSGGQMTDWGAHHNDIAQWANGTERTGPVEVNGHSLVKMIPGGYDAAAEYHIKFRYANGVTMIVLNDEVVPNGVKFVGDKGDWIFVTRGKIESSKPEMITEPLPEDALRLYRSDDHMGNFFECVRSRKQPICDAEIGHRSISTAHLGVISVRLGLPLRWDPQNEEFVGDNASEGNKMVAREMRKPYDYSFIA